MRRDVLNTENIWARHSNPKSGWSRMAAGFMIVGALYYRKWRLVGLTVLFMIFNPVLFPEPTEEPDDWMYKAVRAEERWTNDGNRLIGFGYPQILNTVSIPVGLYGLYAAYKRKPISAVVFPIVSQVLNQWCMKEIIEYYDEADSQEEPSDSYRSANLSTGFRTIRDRIQKMIG